MTIDVDRRQMTRLKVQCSVWLCLAESSNGVLCQTENLSGDGFSCVVSEPFVPGSHLDCVFSLPSHHARLYARARLVWRRAQESGDGYEIGSQFLRFHLVVPRNDDIDVRTHRTEMVIPFGD